MAKTEIKIEISKVITFDIQGVKIIRNDAGWITLARKNADGVIEVVTTDDIESLKPHWWDNNIVQLLPSEISEIVHKFRIKTN